MGKTVFSCTSASRKNRSSSIYGMIAALRAARTGSKPSLTPLTRDASAFCWSPPIPSLPTSSDSERGVKLLGDAREGWAAIKYENGVQWIDELLAEKEKSEDDE